MLLTVTYNGFYVVKRIVKSLESFNSLFGLYSTLTVWYRLTALIIPVYIRQTAVFNKQTLIDPLHYTAQQQTNTQTRLQMNDDAAACQLDELFAYILAKATFKTEMRRHNFRGL